LLSIKNHITLTLVVLSIKMGHRFQSLKFINYSSIKIVFNMYVCAKSTLN